MTTRLAWLRAFRKGVASRERELCDAMLAEVGKPRFEAFMGDILGLLSACRWLEREAPGLLRDRRVSGGPLWLGRLRVVERRVPVGRVAIIATWNYPVQLLGIQLAQAMAAGNRVVVKPSERSPGTQALLLGIARDAARSAGLPEETISWTEATREAGAALLRERFDHVVFTGSTPVGLEIAKFLAPTLTPATLELSGRDSALVLDDADAALAAQTLWAAICVNNGQTCMAPRRALVHDRVYDAFVAALRAIAEKTPHRALIDEASARHCDELCRAALRAGGTRVGGAIEAPEGRRFRPSAIIDCPPDSPLVEGRHFGPCLAVVRVASLDEALAIHDRCDQHLTVSVFTRDPARAQALAPRLHASNLFINDAILPVGHPGVSLGGHGQSGIGLSRGSQGLLALTRPVYVSFGRGAGRNFLRPISDSLADKAIHWLCRIYGGAAPNPPSALPFPTKNHP